jgi:Protein of unknown function (DUF1571)
VCRLTMCLTMCLLLALSMSLLMAAPRPEPPAQAPSPASATFSQEPLPAADALAFLEKCLERYDQMGIRGYRLIFQKQERLKGTLQPTEVTEVFFRAKPYSVFMRWLRGARKTDKVLYVEGQNDDKVLVHPTGVAGMFVRYVPRDPEGSEAREEGRYSVKDFGLKKTVERTLRDFKTAQTKGAQTAYLGVRKVREAGDRLCYTLRQTSPVPDATGVSDATVYIDKETWFQIGTVLKGDGKLMGDYYYRDIQLNPAFEPDQFQPAALSR